MNSITESMSLTEIRALKKEAEEAVEKAITEFIKKTGVSVRGVEVVSNEGGCWAMPNEPTRLALSI